jgi:hypothetical protein
MASITRKYTLLFDKSGSMNYSASSDPNDNRSRWEQLEELSVAILNKVQKLDPAGVTAILFGSTIVTKNNVTTRDLQSIFAEEPADQKTDLLAALRVVANQLAEMIQNSPDSQMTAIVFTDGQPEKGTEEEIRNLIVKMANVCQDDTQFAISFLQLGDDKKATVFLDYLDTMKEDATLGMKFDVVDTKRPSDFDAGMTVDQYLMAAITD